MKVRDLVARFMNAKELEVKPRTVEWYRYNLDPLVEDLGHRDVARLTTEDLEIFLAAQVPGRSAKTQEGFYGTLVTLFKWAVERRYLSADDNPMRPIPSPRRKRQDKIPEIFSDEEIRALLQAADNRRDVAILLILLDTGVRRNELLAMDVKDVDFCEGFILVHGKGGKDRYVPIGQKAVIALRSMLLEHPGDGPLFQNSLGKRLQAGGLRSMLLRLKKKAGLDCPVHPHKFRHTMARHYLKMGDLESLREILGHADIRMTAKVYGTFLRSWIKEKHRMCSPVDNGCWDQQELDLRLR